jgi:hypothetical protein
MLKTVYEKWEELFTNTKDTKQSYIVTYYLGSSSATNLYFSIEKGKLVAYIEFTKEVLADTSVPCIKGMNISVVSVDFINPIKKYIRIENDVDKKEIFIAFTSSLADILMNTSTYFDVYERFKQVVKEYKDYFANPNFSLTKIQEQGLCAELLELAKVIDKKGEVAVLNWQGPSKNKRDFVFDNYAVEVKSTTSQINSSITIANENQLDYAYPINLKKLYLSVYIIEEVDEGFNVNSCANKVLELIKSVTLKEAFKISLLKLKVDLEIYKPGHNFTVQKNIYYDVNALFPKITKETVDKRIFSVSYKINISELYDFEVSENNIYE